MAAKFGGDGVVFSSGRSIYANCGLVSITEHDDGTFRLGEGYDGGIDWPTRSRHPSAIDANDMRELADLMIETWTRFRKSLP